jgi:hypothetical protein
VKDTQLYIRDRFTLRLNRLWPRAENFWCVCVKSSFMWSQIVFSLFCYIPSVLSSHSFPTQRIFNYLHCHTVCVRHRLKSNRKNLEHQWLSSRTKAAFWVVLQQCVWLLVLSRLCDTRRRYCCIRASETVYLRPFKKDVVRGSIKLVRKIVTAYFLQIPGFKHEIRFSSLNFLTSTQ